MRNTVWMGQAPVQVPGRVVVLVVVVRGRVVVVLVLVVEVVVGPAVVVVVVPPIVVLVVVVVHVEDVGHHLAAAGSHGTRLAAGEDGGHDQLAGGDGRGRAHAGVGSGAVRCRGLVERSRRGHTSVVRDRFLEICGCGRPHRDHE